MRQAQARDAWRRLLEKDRQFQLSGLQIAGKPPLGDIDIELANGMTVVCGLNGVGKTTLLRLLEGALGSADDVEKKTRPALLTDGDFRVRLTLDGGQSTVELGTPADEPSVLLIDAFDSCTRILSVSSQTNFEDLLEGVEPHEHSDDELRRAEYVVGKHYDTLHVFEIEDPDAEDSVLPFFRASAAGTMYDSRTMGLGELAALSTLWGLSRAEAGTVVLLEEPETFLSSRATVALADVVAESVHARRLYAVMTTHAAEIVARVPFQTVRVLLPSQGGVALRAPVSQAELEHLLGSYVGQARIAVVEDATAALVTSELLGRLAGLWGQSIEVLPANGVDGVLAACRSLPIAAQIRVVGILDGDQAVPDQPGWPLLTLPGPQDPDSMLRTAALGDLEAFASGLGRDHNTVNSAVQPLEGLDAHDWFPSVAETLSLERNAVLRAALDVWLAKPENQHIGANLVQEIVGVLTS